MAVATDCHQFACLLISVVTKSTRLVIATYSALAGKLLLELGYLFEYLISVLVSFHWHHQM